MQRPRGPRGPDIDIDIDIDVLHAASPRTWGHALDTAEMARVCASERASKQARALYLHSERDSVAVTVADTTLLQAQGHASFDNRSQPLGSCETACVAPGFDEESRGCPRHGKR